MSVKNPINQPYSLFGFGQQPGGAFPQTQKSVQTAGTNPFQTKFGGGQPPIGGQPDQLGLFQSQIKSGQINPNLNQPGLPYTASRGWSA
jgi:hypothetical protein